VIVCNVLRSSSELITLWALCARRPPRALRPRPRPERAPRGNQDPDWPAGSSPRRRQRRSPSVRAALLGPERQAQQLEREHQAAEAQAGDTERVDAIADTLIRELGQVTTVLREGEPEERVVRSFLQASGSRSRRGRPCCGGTACHRLHL
jgi:hypothetical protein